MSNKDLSRIKSPSDNIMRSVLDDKGIGVQANRCMNELYKMVLKE